VLPGVLVGGSVFGPLRTGVEYSVWAEDSEGKPLNFIPEFISPFLFFMAGVTTFDIPWERSLTRVTGKIIFPLPGRYRMEIVQNGWPQDRVLVGEARFHFAVYDDPRTTNLVHQGEAAAAAAEAGSSFLLQVPLLGPAINALASLIAGEAALTLSARPPRKPAPAAPADAAAKAACGSYEQCKPWHSAPRPALLRRPPLRVCRAADLAALSSGYPHSYWFPCSYIKHAADYQLCTDDGWMWGGPDCFVPKTPAALLYQHVVMFKRREKRPINIAIIGDSRVRGVMLKLVQLVMSKWAPDLINADFVKVWGVILLEVREVRV
jgi:hypothetical protein